MTPAQAASLLLNLRPEISMLDGTLHRLRFPVGRAATACLAIAARAMRANFSRADFLDLAGQFYDVTGSDHGRH